ncbi:metalloregulator ArsR/SmtB family transcription factor [Nesterenkonia sp. HG001]|uniref:ArsR/SmtB family transcription factor n=1 Tax=Nesterenkonia sp. HG001 TaxID=2983207 RepID=UPI002AC68B5B|nr:metalloregulator ArsR/SmtB family transcription factor [Nesterenkonia sp. HG001]MDZ5078329.1 metalloregulator ArsR/SmtB family transcription factor [Nesterenkonia sp. HG001]
MHDEHGVVAAAQLFKVLGNESRLQLLQLLGESPRTVGTLVEVTGMSQPLVSQHLRSLKQAGLVAADRHGKAMNYHLADDHVAHIVDDAIAHVEESHTTKAADRRPGRISP